MASVRCPDTEHREDRLSLPLGCRHPTLVFALGMGFGDALALAFEHHRPIELGDGAEDLNDELAGSGSGGVGDT